MTEDFQAILKRFPQFRTYEGNTLIKQFQSSDQDRDGHLSASELQSIAQSRGEQLSPEDAQQLVQKVGGSDNKISFEQFLQVSSAKIA